MVNQATKDVTLTTYIIIKQLASLTEVLSHAHTTVDTNLLNLAITENKWNMSWVAKC